MWVQLQYMWYVVSGERRTDRLIDRAIVIYDLRVDLLANFGWAMELVVDCLPKRLLNCAKGRQSQAKNIKQLVTDNEGSCKGCDGV